MNPGTRLGVFGGTFDPIHVGHLDAAAAARAAMALDRVLFLPSHDPPHRPVDPRTTPFHRFALISLAVAEHPGYLASDIELARPGPSYTIDTLRALHLGGWSPLQLFFIIGADAFAEISTWRAFPAVMDAAHFVVVGRPGATLDRALGQAPQVRVRTRGALERDTSTDTGVYLVEARTRDVSSTMIRARLAAGESIGNLVPPAVEAHIRAHDLYAR